jgi:hypothetical protein
MAGLLYYMMEVSDSPFDKPSIHFSFIAPDKALMSIYDEKYSKFLQYQKLLNAGRTGEV